MIEKTYKIGLLALFAFISCNQAQETSDNLQVIDVQSNIEKMEVVKLSEISTNIRYVPLETGSDIFFQGLWECVFSDSLILARDLNKCILFDIDGNFKTRIGKNGRGPGEYFNLKCSDFGVDSNIFIQGNMSLYEYKLDGSFINQYNNIFRLNNGTYDINRWKEVGESLFLGHVANSNGQIKDKALIIDKNGDIKHNYKNFILFDRERPQHGHFEDFAHINKIGANFFYKECFNDTLYLLDEKFNLVPQYVFNLGKYKVPTTLRLQNRISDYWNYIILWEIFQTKELLLLRFEFMDLFPARRLTPKSSIFPGGDPVWRNTTFILGIFNKLTKQLVFCKPSDTDNPLYTTGLYNDIDCGPRFFPSEQVNDSTFVMKIDAKNFIEHVVSDDFKNGVPKYPRKKKQLEELANRLTDYDNPVLMFVTINK